MLTLKQESLGPRHLPLFRGSQFEGRRGASRHREAEQPLVWLNGIGNTLEEVAEGIPLDVRTDQETTGQFHAIASFAQQ